MFKSTEEYRHWFSETMDVWGIDEVASVAAINIFMHYILGYANFRRPTESSLPRRLGGLTIVAWTILSVSHDGLIDAFRVMGRLLQAGIYGWFVRNASGIVVAICERFDVVAKDIAKRHRNAWAAAARARQEEVDAENRAIQMEAERLQKARRDKEQAEASRAAQEQQELEEKLKREQDERERPERERRQREAAAKAAEKTRIAAEKSRQIAAIRYELELLYERCRPTLREMPEERFFAYFETHLTMALSVDEYRKRAEKLKETILSLADVKAESPVKFRDLEHVIEHFNTKKQRLKYLELDEDTLEVLLIKIDDERDRSIREML